MTVLAGQTTQPHRRHHQPRHVHTEAVLHAFMENPTLEWTPQGLAAWYGIRIDLVNEAIETYVHRGILRQVHPGTFVLDAQESIGA